MKVLAAGYEFAHRDDYEGRDVLPSIKIDADSRNIEDLESRSRMPELLQAPQYRQKSWRTRASNEERFLGDYEGMMPQMEERYALVIDDISHHETG
jgi:nitrogenase molybdenum-iron protein alpha chain